MFEINNKKKTKNSRIYLFHQRLVLRTITESGSHHQKKNRYGIGSKENPNKIKTIASVMRMSSKRSRRL